MVAFRLSVRAKGDLASIAIYTEREWGERQAEKYVHELELCCMRLAQNPMIGRAVDPQRPRTRRMEHGSHVVFYRKEGSGIFIQRILHKGMSPSNYLR